MKNQNQNQKPILHLRVYNAYGKNAELAYDRGGKVLNDNQIIKIQHDTLEYRNLLKNLKFLGYVKFDIEKITILNSKLEWEESKESKDKYQHELNKAFYGEEEAEAMLEESTDEGDNTIAPTGEDELKSLKEAYIEVFGKKPFHKWTAEDLKEKIKAEKQLT